MTGTDRMPTSTEAPVVGGRYAIERRLHGGGEAEVFLARDRELGLDVVLKSQVVRDPGWLAEFRREAATLMRVTPHRGLPIVRSDVVEGDRYYLVSDYVAGDDLATYVASAGGMLLADVLDLVDQIASILGHLHAHRPAVVHGDVKPENLVVAGDGHVVLVDFGSALRAGEAGGQFGTVGYSAPELLAGEVLGPTADVYSLAATTAFALTGVVPRVGVDWPAALQDAGFGRLERVIRSGLTWDPLRRPRSGSGMRVAGALRTGACAISTRRSCSRRFGRREAFRSRSSGESMSGAMRSAKPWRAESGAP